MTDHRELLINQKRFEGMWIWRRPEGREGKDNSKVTMGCKVVLGVALLYSLKVSVMVRTGKELGEHFVNIISRKSSAVDVWMIVGP